MYDDDQITRMEEHFRAFGDLVATQAGVSSDPDIKEFQLKPDEDVFVIVCSDGVWEFISTQEAVEMVAKYSRTEVSDCSQRWRGGMIVCASYLSSVVCTDVLTQLCMRACVSCRVHLV